MKAGVCVSFRRMLGSLNQSLMLAQQKHFHSPIMPSRSPNTWVSTPWPPDPQVTTVDQRFKGEDKGMEVADRTCGSGWALTEIVSEPLAILSRYDPFVLQVTLVPHEDDLGIVPGIGFDLCSPVELWTLRGRLEIGKGRTKSRGMSVVGQRLPVLHSGEGLLVGDVIHEQEAHGPAVVGCSDCPVALLACCILGKQQSVS